MLDCLNYCNRLYWVIIALAQLLKYWNLAVEKQRVKMFLGMLLIKTTEHKRDDANIPCGVFHVHYLSNDGLGRLFAACNQRLTDGETN